MKAGELVSLNFRLIPVFPVLPVFPNHTLQHSAAAMTATTLQMGESEWNAGSVARVLRQVRVGGELGCG